jgi:restriction system protein
MAKIDKERLGVYLKTAMQVLKDNGGQLPSRDVIRETERRLQLTEYEKAILEKTGYVRWETILHFYSIDLLKAGWLVKKKGVWYATPEGIANLKLSPKEFASVANQKYREWKRAQTAAKEEIPEAGETGEERKPSAYDQAVGIAREEIRSHINNMDAYAFQELVAALLRAMGYYTPFVAPKGPDGGIDILAYRDAFGTQTPRIKVQVKHRTQKATVQEVRQLIGLLHEEGDTGLFVSSAGFTDDAVGAIRSSSKHIEKLELDTIIDLWEEHYDKMQEEDRALLPLRRIAFLAPSE